MRIAPDIVLMGYGRTQTFQISCLKCKDKFFPDNEEAFCDKCNELPIEVKLKYVKPQKIGAVYFADVVGWEQRTSCTKIRSHYNFKKVYKRDGFTCQYCGYTPGTAPKFRALHIDHIIPFSYGGSNKMENLVVACEWCNHHLSNLVFKSFLHKKEYILDLLTAGRKNKENATTGQIEASETRICDD